MTGRTNALSHRFPTALFAMVAAIALVVLPGLVVEPVPAAAASDPSLTLSSMTPKAPTAKDTLDITGTVRNPSRLPLVDVSVRLRVTPTAMTSRGSLDDYAGEEGVPSGNAVYGHEANVGRLARGASGEFHLRVPAKDLGLTSFGVYPVALEAVAGDGTSLAVERTFLVYTPDKKSVPKPTKIGWMLPLLEPSHRELGNVFADDGLTEAMATDGRLGRILAAGHVARTEQVPATWAVDPALLDDANTMSKGYRVRSPDSKRPVKGKGGEQAQQFLDSVKTTTAQQTVLPLPYADVDTVALARAGLTTDVTTAVSQGKNIVDDTLPDATPATSFAWPADGKVDQQGMDNLASNGARTVVLKDSALPLAETLDYTPDPLATTRTASGSVKVLLADSSVTKILEQSSGESGDGALTEQRFLAETALISAERPSQSRGLVVAPPRYWNPPGDLASNLMDDSANVPWLQPTSLADLGAGDPPEELTRQRLTYGKRAREAELTPSHLKRVRELHGSLDVFSSLFNPLPDNIRDYNLAVFRTESAAWRERRGRGRSLLKAVTKAVKQERSQVRILLKDRQISLTGSEGKPPITIENDLDSPVTVQLDVKSTNSTRVQVGEYEQKVTIPAHGKSTRQIPVRAKSSGVIDLRVQLFTPDRRAYAPATTFQVRSAVYGKVAVIITASGLVVLFAGAGYRVVRRVLSSRAHKHGGAGRVS